MYNVLARYVLYPIAETFIGTRMLKYLKRLEDTQWWSPDQIRELQHEKLRTIIKHAYENVPYYHRIFNERGLTDKDIQTADDLQKLPVLTKDSIRQNFTDLVAKDTKNRKPLLNATSGSTGEPLKYYVDMAVTSINWAGTFRGWGWAGYKLGDKRATLAGSSLVPDTSPSLIKRLRWKGERDMPFSAVHLDNDRLALYAAKMSAYKPKFVRGYPSAVYSFACYLQKKGINTIKPVAVFTTAEMLLPQHREVIEKQFGCRVFDQYGCYDGGLQAMECSEHSGFHISAEKVVMEFINVDGKPVSPGVSGEILATDLYNYSMPFIRYAVGDKGTLSTRQCQCGRGLPLMESLEGRTTDVLVFGNGVTLSGPALTLVFKDCHIKQYQVIQETRDKLVIKIIKADDYSDNDTNHFMKILRAHIGNKVDIELQFVDEIRTTKAGKWKFIISRLGK
jgi:phenylacetate-CoA ligase